MKLEGLEKHPLHDAVVTGDLARVEKLLESGADPEKRIGIGVTPLDLALGLDRQEIAGILIRHGAKNLRRVLQIIVERIDSEGFIEAYGVEFSVEGPEGWFFQTGEEGSGYLPASIRWSGLNSLFDEQDPSTLRPQACALILRQWMMVLEKDGIRKILDRYAAYSRMDSHATHRAAYTIRYLENQKIVLDWTEICGGNENGLPDGILRDFMASTESILREGTPVDIPEAYLESLDALKHTIERWMEHVDGKPGPGSLVRIPAAAIDMKES